MQAVMFGHIKSTPDDEARPSAGDELLEPLRKYAIDYGVNIVLDCLAELCEEMAKKIKERDEHWPYGRAPAADYEDAAAKIRGLGYLNRV